MSWHPPVRAVHDAVTVPGVPEPYGTVHLRVDFPAAAVDSGDDRLGLLPPDLSQGPLPVVVFAGNFNCGPELYLWLAKALAQQGICTVTWSWVTLLHGTRAGLSNGIDLEAVSPRSLGVLPPSRLLDPLLAGLDRLNATELSGVLDLDAVVLGGHSAGGTWALLCARSPWWPQLRGAFSYGGHTRAQVPQGFGADAYLPLPGSTPLLLMGGTHDGVVDAIAQRQLGAVPPGHPMSRTHDVAGAGSRFIAVSGADHYAVAEGYDGSTGRGYLEDPGPTDPAEVRRLVGSAVTAFVRECTGRVPDWSRVLDDPLVADHRVS